MLDNEAEDRNSRKHIEENIFRIDPHAHPMITQGISLFARTKC